MNHIFEPINSKSLTHTLKITLRTSRTHTPNKQIDRHTNKPTPTNNNKKYDNQKLSKHIYKHFYFPHISETKNPNPLTHTLKMSLKTSRIHTPNKQIDRQTDKPTQTNNNRSTWAELTGSTCHARVVCNINKHTLT